PWSPRRPGDSVSGPSFLLRLWAQGGEKRGHCAVQGCGNTVLLADAADRAVPRIGFEGTSGTPVREEGGARVTGPLDHRRDDLVREALIEDRSDGAAHRHALDDDGKEGRVPSIGPDSLLVLDAVLKDGDRRASIGKRAEPGACAGGLVRLGREEHPRNGTKTLDARRDLRSGLQDAAWGLDDELIERLAN